MSSSTTESSTSSSSLSSPLLNQGRGRLSSKRHTGLNCLASLSSSPSSKSVKSSQSNYYTISDKGIPSSRWGSYLCIIESLTNTDRSSGGLVSGRSKEMTGPEKPEKLIVMKCQRLKLDRTFEEIEIELPSVIYNRFTNQNSKSKSNNNFCEMSLSRKIKNIFNR